MNIYSPIKNKYFNWYQSLVLKAKNRTLKNTVYQEKHHIIPKCLGGNDYPDNLISLTLREHYIAHLLLSKMYEGEAKRKMYYGLWRMLLNFKTRNSRVFELYRQKYINESLKTQIITDEFRQKVSKNTKGVKKTITEKVLNKNKRLKEQMMGFGNPMYGRKQSETTKKLMSEKRKAYFNDPDNRKKQKEAILGKKHTKETKEKMKESHKKRLNFKREDIINRV